MNLNFVSDMPLHKQVQVKLLKDINKGMYHRDARLPSIRQMSRLNLVSSVTVERAYRQLMKDGLVSYVKGKGYYLTGTVKVLLLLNLYI